MKHIYTFFIFFIFFFKGYAQHSIIPVPVSFESINEEFLFDTAIFINLKTSNKEALQYTNQFKAYLGKHRIDISKKKVKKTIRIQLSKRTISEIGDEGYSLEINSKKIQIIANKPAGIFNAFQTLKQLFPIQTTGSVILKGCKIIDYPRFKWRGLMLDVSRHFFTVDEVKAYIDKMSEYKFNVFHWHLTDDQGWRIEIKSLPKLTEVGAWRVKRHGFFGRPAPKSNEKATDGGFYTQEQIKDIIKYAANRNITIVPEIDMPGHSMAALAAYPELSTRKEHKFVNPGSTFSKWYGGGKFEMFIENTLNPTDEKVYEFVDKVFTEVAALFPGEYIHMGGDEAFHGYWEKDSSVQKFMKKNKIENTHQLQSYFVKRVEKIINSKGKKMIGWNEILDGGLAENAAVMSWQGMKGGIKAAKMKHNVVMTPTTFAYLDYTQGDRSIENKVYANLSLEKTYEFEPVPDGVDKKYILGGQGNLWTEKVQTMPFAFYMTYPRAFSLAETFWSKKEHKNWDRFITRTIHHFSRFDNENLNVSKAVYDPIIRMAKKNGKLMCELKNSVPNTTIYYTIDNTYPVQFGEKYTEPFEIPEGKLSLRTQTFLHGKAIGRELFINRKELVKRVKK